MQTNSKHFYWLVELTTPQENETYHMEKSNYIDKTCKFLFGSEKAIITNLCAGNELEQSAVDMTRSEEHIWLADIYKVRKTQYAPQQTSNS